MPSMYNETLRAELRRIDAKLIDSDYQSEQERLTLIAWYRIVARAIIAIA